MKRLWLRLKDPYNAMFLTLAPIGLFLRWQSLYGRSLWVDELEQLRSLAMPLRNLLTVYLPGIPGGYPGDYLLT